jgi:hypothetical protein
MHGVGGLDGFMIPQLNMFSAIHLVLVLVIYAIYDVIFLPWSGLAMS